MHILQTEKRHADAWCDYSYYGRLRSWDGLIVLVGVPVSFTDESIISDSD